MNRSSAFTSTALKAWERYYSAGGDNAFLLQAAHALTPDQCRAFLGAQDSVAHLQAAVDHMAGVIQEEDKGRITTILSF